MKFKILAVALKIANKADLMKKKCGRPLCRNLKTLLREILIDLNKWWDLLYSWNGRSKTVKLLMYPNWLMGL